MLPFDLHVLSIPPAFNLSHDQTLQFNDVTFLSFETNSEEREPKFKCSKNLLFRIDFNYLASQVTSVYCKLCKFFKALFVLPLRVPTQIVFLLFDLF